MALNKITNAVPLEEEFPREEEDVVLEETFPQEANTKINNFFKALNQQETKVNSRVVTNKTNNGNLGEINQLISGKDHDHNQILEVRRLLKKKLSGTQPEKLKCLNSKKTNKKFTQSQLLNLALMFFVTLLKLVTLPLRFVSWHFSSQTMHQLMENQSQEDHSKTDLRCTKMWTSICGRLWNIFSNCPKCLTRKTISAKESLICLSLMLFGAAVILWMVIIFAKFMMFTQLRTGMDNKAVPYKMEQMKTYQVKENRKSTHRNLLNFEDVEKKGSDKSFVREYLMQIFNVANDELTLIQSVIKWYFIISVFKFTLEILVYLIQILNFLKPIFGFCFNFFSTRKGFLEMMPPLCQFRSNKKVIRLFLFLILFLIPVGATVKNTDQSNTDWQKVSLNANQTKNGVYLIIFNERNRMYDLQINKILFKNETGTILSGGVVCTGLNEDVACTHDAGGLHKTEDCKNYFSDTNIFEHENLTSSKFWPNHYMRMREMFGIQHLFNNTIQYYQRFYRTLHNIITRADKTQTKNYLKFVVASIVGLQLRFGVDVEPSVYLCGGSDQNYKLKDEIINMLEKDSYSISQMIYITNLLQLRDLGVKNRDIGKHLKSIVSKTISIIERDDVDLLKLNSTKTYVLRDKRFKSMTFQNLTIKNSDRVLITKIRGINLGENSDKFIDAGFEGYITLDFYSLKLIEGAFKRDTNLHFKCVDVPISILDSYIICSHRVLNSGYVWLDHSKLSIEEVEITEKDNLLIYSYQSLKFGGEEYVLALVSKPESKFQCKEIERIYDKTRMIATQRMECQKMRIKKITWQDDKRLIPSDQKFYKNRKFVKFVLFLSFPFFAFLAIKITKYLLFMVAQWLFLTLYVLKIKRKLQFVVNDYSGKLMNYRIVERRSFRRLLKSWPDIKFLIRSYLFPMHILIQLIYAFLIPLILIVCLSTRHPIVKAFPISFWFGKAQSFYNGAQLDPCNTENCTVEDSVVYTRFILSLDTPAKLNGHDYCLNLKNMDLNKFNVELLPNANEDSFELISQDCTENLCERKVIYQSTIPLFPCSKLRIKQKNGLTKYIIIQDINWNLIFNVESYSQPFKTRTYNTYMGCGKSYCTKQLPLINDPKCRYSCEAQDAVERKLYNKEINTKSPFQHVLLDNNPEKAFLSFNTKFRFRCENLKADCYNFDNHVFSYSDREVLIMDVLEHGNHDWLLVLVKIEDKRFSAKIHVIDGENDQIYDIYEDSSKIDHNDFQIDYKINVDDSKLPEYLLFGFREMSVGKYASISFELNDRDKFDDLVNFYCTNGYQKKGISDNCIYSSKSLFTSSDVSFEQLDSQLSKNFNKIDLDNETGFKFVITNMIEKTLKAVPDDIKKNIQNIENIKKPEDNEVKIVEFEFNLFIHKPNYGSLALKIQTSEDVIQEQHIGSKIKIKLNACKGKTGYVSGMVLNITREDELESVAHLECVYGTIQSSCGFFILKATEENQIFYLTLPDLVSDSTSIKLIQTFPIVKEKSNVILEPNCQINHTKLEFADIGSQIRDFPIQYSNETNFANFFYRISVMANHASNYIIDEIKEFNFFSIIKIFYYLLIVVLLFLVISLIKNYLTKDSGYRRLP